MFRGVMFLRALSLQVDLAKGFCHEANERSTQLLDQLVSEVSEITDMHYMKVADRVFENKGYCAEHPLKRND